MVGRCLRVGFDPGFPLATANSVVDIDEANIGALLIQSETLTIDLGNLAIGGS